MRIYFFAVSLALNNSQRILTYVIRGRITVEMTQVLFDWFGFSYFVKLNISTDLLVFF